MDIHYELFGTKERNATDLRDYAHIIVDCFQEGLPGYPIEVKEREIIVKNYPQNRIPTMQLREISTELGKHPELDDCWVPIKTMRLLRKRL